MKSYSTSRLKSAISGALILIPATFLFAFSAIGFFALIGATNIHQARAGAGVALICLGPALFLLFLSARCIYLLFYPGTLLISAKGLNFNVAGITAFWPWKVLGEPILLAGALKTIKFVEKTGNYKFRLSNTWDANLNDIIEDIKSFKNSSADKFEESDRAYSRWPSLWITILGCALSVMAGYVLLMLR